MTDLASPTLAALRSRIVRVFPVQIRAAVENLSDNEMWWRPNEKSNSIGNLILHVSGSLNHYLNRNLGGMDYTRDRDGEFAARGPMPKAELMAIFDTMVSRADQTLGNFAPERLTGPSTDPERNAYVVDDLVSIATHLATHMGQIVWIAKMLREGSLNEVWMHAHKRGGAWKQ